MQAPLARKRPVPRALRVFGLSLLGALSCRPAPVTIRAGLLLDGRGHQARDAVVTITGSRITAVAPWRGEPVTWDLSGLTVLPGLIDAHVHIGGHFNPAGRIASAGDGETPQQQEAARAANALATLRAGFTTVASMGAGTDKELRERINSGRIPGPRLLSSLAQILGSGESPDSLRLDARLVARRGADFVKIFASRSINEGGNSVLTQAQLSALCDEARRLRLRSVVHAHDDSSIARAAAAGCDQVEHGFLASAGAFRILADSGVLFDPQCGLVLRNYLEHRLEYEGPGGYRPDQFLLMEQLLPKLPGVLRAALATPGLRVLYGTDATAGAHGRNAEDLVCRVREAGEAPMDALVSATSLNAGSLGLGDSLGTVAPGYLADLIALEGNPLDSIEAVRRVRFVMKGGSVVLAPRLAPADSGRHTP